MDFTAVTDPIRCPDAFRYESSDALQAQAACLLILGIHLRRDVEAMRARSDEDEIDSDVLPSDDMEQFPVPQVRRGPTRRSASDLQSELLQRSLPLLLDAVRKRENLPLVLTILADIGDMRLETLFREFSTDEEASVAQAARQGLETIRLRAHAPEAMP